VNKRYGEEFQYIIEVSCTENDEMSRKASAAIHVELVHVRIIFLFNLMLYQCTSDVMEFSIVQHILLMILRRVGWIMDLNE
jgi:hypothetical protein